MKQITVKEARKALLRWKRYHLHFTEAPKLIAIRRLLRAQERRIRELENAHDYKAYPYWVGYRILDNCRGIKFYTFDHRTNRRISTSTVMCNPGMTLSERQEEITCAASCRNIDISFEEKAKQAKGDV